MESDMGQLQSKLERHSDTLSSLSKQIKLVRHVPLEVSSLRDDLLNIIAQFSTGMGLLRHTLYSAAN